MSPARVRGEGALCTAGRSAAGAGRAGAWGAAELTWGPEAASAAEHAVAGGGAVDCPPPPSNSAPGCRSEKRKKAFESS